jgi:hypothetical protein
MLTTRSAAPSSASTPVSAALSGAAGTAISWWEASWPATRCSVRTAAISGAIVAFVYVIRTMWNPERSSRSVSVRRV